MDWLSIIGRQRPLEQDALRLLLVVHELGKPTETVGTCRELSGESRLQRLDQLVRQPAALAFMLLDQLRRERLSAGRRAAWMRRLRRLVVQGDKLSGRSQVFHLGGWERWDDVLAFLGCRNLLRVLPAEEIRYLVTDRGAEVLGERVFGGDKTFSGELERCRLLRDGLPSASTLDLGEQLPALAERLEKIRREAQLSPEDDLLDHLFHDLFGEPL